MSAEAPAFVTLGAHVLDVLGRYVTEIPAGQGGTLIEQIRLSPAGSAGGTAVTLAKLGGRVTSAGAIGNDDLGEVLARALERFGVDTSALVRQADVQTSATILPIRPNGERPALHVIGANGAYAALEPPWETIAAADYLHLGAPELLGAERPAEILRFAREHGAVTSLDFLADGWPELLDMVAPALEHVDYVMPNADQAIALTGEPDVIAAARALVARGAGCAAVTCGADGSVIVDADSVERVPAFEVEVVDTTGCGDAYSAGFLRGLSLGEDRRRAAELGSACAGLVAGGLGSDAGDFDLERVIEFCAGARRRPLP